jgi:hypothetical protein
MTLAEMTVSPECAIGPGTVKLATGLRLSVTVRPIESALCRVDAAAPKTCLTAPPSR